MVCYSLSSDQVTFLQEGVVIRFWNFEWAPNSIKSYDLTPPSPALCYVRVDKGGIFKSCLCVLKVCIWLWGVGGNVWRWFVRQNFRLCQCEAKGPCQVCEDTGSKDPIGRFLYLTISYWTSVESTASSPYPVCMWDYISKKMLKGVSKEVSIIGCHVFKSHCPNG